MGVEVFLFTLELMKVFGSQPADRGLLGDVKVVCLGFFLYQSSNPLK